MNASNPFSQILIGMTFLVAATGVGARLANAGDTSTPLSRGLSTMMEKTGIHLHGAKTEPQASASEKTAFTKGIKRMLAAGSLMSPMTEETIRLNQWEARFMKILPETALADMPEKANAFATFETAVTAYDLAKYAARQDGAPKDAIAFKNEKERRFSYLLDRFKEGDIGAKNFMEGYLHIIYDRSLLTTATTKEQQKKVWADIYRTLSEMDEALRLSNAVALNKIPESPMMNQIATREAMKRRAQPKQPGAGLGGNQ